MSMRLRRTLIHENGSGLSAIGYRLSAIGYFRVRPHAPGAHRRMKIVDCVGHYAGLANDEDAAARTAEIQSTLSQTYLAWYGPTTQGSAAYFRITGPTIVIEYSPQEMGGDPANHIHGVYRDPTNDYGAALTK